MANEKENQKEPNSKELNNLTPEQVVMLITSLQRDNNASLTEALAKLSPNYKSPEQIKFNEEAKESQKNIQLSILKNQRRRQKACEHETGQNGRMRTGEGSFFGLKLPTGETVGVCSYCQGVISSANPDHMRFFKKINGVVAEAGQYSGLGNSEDAQLARLSPDERKHVKELRKQYFAVAPEKADETEVGFF